VIAVVVGAASRYCSAVVVGDVPTSTAVLIRHAAYNIGMMKPIYLIALPTVGCGAARRIEEIRIFKIETSRTASVSTTINHASAPRPLEPEAKCAPIASEIVKIDVPRAISRVVIVDAINTSNRIDIVKTVICIGSRLIEINSIVSRLGCALYCAVLYQDIAGSDTNSISRSRQDVEPIHGRPSHVCSVR